MQCKHHHEAEAKFICEKCRQPICEACAIEIGTSKVCKSCTHEALSRGGKNNHSYSFEASAAPPHMYMKGPQVEKRSWLESFIFFCFSTIPGAGQMYQGLFKRGLQLMITFIAGIVLPIYINLESLVPLIVIPTWFFSFFDAYHNRRIIRQGESVEDMAAYNYDLLIGNKKYLGVAFLILGIFGFVNAITADSHYIRNLLGVDLHGIYWIVRKSILPLLLITIGTLVVRKSKIDKGEAV